MNQYFKSNINFKTMNILLTERHQCKTADLYLKMANRHSSHSHLNAQNNSKKAQDSFLLTTRTSILTSLAYLL